MQPSVDPYGKQVTAQRRLIIGSSIAATAMLALGIGLSVLASRGPQSTPLMPVVSKPPTPMLQAQASPPPPALQAENGMPKDILDWLKHLQETNDSCTSLSKSQIGGLLLDATRNSVTMGLDPKTEMFGDEGPNVEKTPATGVAVQSDDIAKKFTALENDFNAKPPPVECADIASNFNQALQETEQMTLEISKSLKDSSQDPNAAITHLTSIMNESKKRIDPYRSRTDALVQSICDKYKTRKWFAIDSDVDSGVSKFIDQINPVTNGGH